MTSAPSSGGAPVVRVASRGDVYERCCASRLLLLPSTGDAVELVGPAALVWELLRDGIDMDDLLSRVASTYGEDRESIAPLVHSTVEQLRGHRLVTMTE